MIYIRPLHPVSVVGDSDTVVASFEDSEWWNLITLVRRYGFGGHGHLIFEAGAYDQPVEIDAATSRVLWGATTAAYTGGVYPEGSDELVLVKRLMDCAQIGAEHGGIEIRRETEAV